jgi:hypothetical protein
MRPLAMPQGSVAGFLDDARRTFFVGGLDLLQADDVGLRLGEPLE